MLDRIGLDRADRRNLIDVMGVVAAATAAVSAGAIGVRLAAGLVAGHISGAACALSTAAIKRIYTAQW